MSNKMTAAQYREILEKAKKKTESPRRIATSAAVPVEGNKMPLRVNVNPLTVNRAWKGKRFRSDDYNEYRKFLLSVLPKEIDMPQPPFEIRLTFGLSNMSSDWDNPCKPFQDVLQEKYSFNDKLIKRAVVEVENVPKDSEYITFEIVSLKQ